MITIKIISHVVFFAICLLWYGCTDSQPKQYDGYEDYPLVQYMRENGWYGMGDSIENYPPDSVLYYGLKIDGKSIQEMDEIYGRHFPEKYDTLSFGISRTWGYPRIYPLAYKIESYPIMMAKWRIHDNVFLYVYFETEDNATRAIYGYQLKDKRRRTHE